MFRDLLQNQNRSEPGRLQTTARKLFPSVVQQSHLKQHLAGSGVPASGKYAIIGVATYSPLELELLDELDTAHGRWEDTAEVAVFDLMGCEDMRSVLEHLPIFAVVKQTPMVAIWDNGKLVASPTGLRMTREALQSYGFLE